MIKRKPRARRGPGNSGRSTIVDVARLAKVSTATVSRVLSDPSDTKAPTRERVLQAIATLNYSPNGLARSLRTSESKRFLVLLSDIANPFFALILKGIEDAAAREGYGILVGDTGSKLHDDTRYSLMLPRLEVDGMIVVSHKVPVAVEPWMKAYSGIPPIVTAFMSGDERGQLSVSVDNAALATEVIEHLYCYGHRQIGVIAAISDSHQMKMRLEALRVVARRENALDQLTIQSGRFTIESGIACAANLLTQSPRPTALICFSDELALGAIEGARQLGLSVPRDVSVVGCDDLPTSAYLTPSLTTVSLPMIDIGRETIRLLTGRIRGTITDHTAIVMPHKLMIRQSTAVFVPRSPHE